MLDTLDKGGDWTTGQRTTEVSLAPAACYGVYPAIGARGKMGAEGALVDCYTYCFRHEPSVDPARMQMFRQREHVRLGSEGQALAFREKWKAARPGDHRLARPAVRGRHRQTTRSSAAAAGCWRPASARRA
jgi:seryl-tRNA synthetase